MSNDTACGEMVSAKTYCVSIGDLIWWALIIGTLWCTLTISNISKGVHVCLTCPTCSKIIEKSISPGRTETSIVLHHYQRHIFNKSFSFMIDS